MLDEWSGDDVDELFELLDAQLGDIGVDIKFEKKAVAAADDAEEEADDDVEEFDDEDEDLDEDDEDLDEEKEEAEEEP
jgi:chromosome segregation ATPase